MNAEPHTHRSRIATQFSHDGPYRVTYGDTKVYVNRLLGPVCIDHTPRISPRKVRRAIARAIRQHDRGSVVAGRREEHLDELHTDLAGILAGYPGEGPAEQWPSTNRNTKTRGQASDAPSPS